MINFNSSKEVNIKPPFYFLYSKKRFEIRKRK